MSRWFRIDDDVVNDPKVQSLSDTLFRAWVNLLCVASKNGGALPLLQHTAFILRVTEAKAAELIAKLHRAGLLDKTDESFKPHNWDARQFLTDRSDPTNADRQKRYRKAKRNADSNVTDNATNTVTAKRPYTETETDTDSVAKATGAEAPLDPSIAERELFDRGKQVLGKSAGGQIAKLKAAKGGNIALARSVIEAASTKHAPAEYVAAAIRAGPPSAKPLTEYQRKQHETKEILDDLANFAAGRSGGGDQNPGLLRHDPGGGPEGLRGGPSGDVDDLSPQRHRASG